MELRNPYRDPDVRPEWAQLSRLAGDRAAILFEELRAAIGDIEGLREDVHFLNAEVGWVPRYRLGEVTLFVVSILPASLRALMELERSEVETLLASRRISQETKNLLRKAAGQDGRAAIRVDLESRGQVVSWARLVKGRSRLAAHQAAH